MDLKENFCSNTEGGGHNLVITSLDIHVLTQSDALQGKGIRVIMVDKHGKKLSEDYYPGKTSSADDIVLRLRKDSETPQQKEGILSKVSKRIRGEQKPYTGHFELVKPDGSVVKVYSEGQNCLYHAVAQATSRDTADLKQKAANLRVQVKDSIQQNQHKYAAALKLQRGYEETSKSPSKYAVVGGARKERDEIREQYQQMLNRIKNEDPKLHDLIKAYNLGLVGPYNDVIGVRRENTQANNNRENTPANKNRSVVNADHIPPQDAFKKAHQKLIETGKLEEYKEKHPRLFSLIDETGNRGLCREVLTVHHQRALTTGNNAESRRIREKLTEVLLSGDEVKLMKMSLIVANPEMSESLRRDAGIQRKYRADNLPVEQTKHYHSIGDRLVVEGYTASGVLNNNQRDRMLSWLDQKEHVKNTPEYRELLGAIESSQEKDENPRKRRQYM